MDKLCECGCGLKVKSGNKRVNGHGAKGVKRTEKTKSNMKKSWTVDRKKKLSERMKEINPMYLEENKEKFRGDNNPAKRLEVRKKISQNNSMKNDQHRETQKAACSTDVERERRSKVMKAKNPSYDKDVVKRRTVTYCDRLANGEIKSYGKWKTGYYKKEWYDSSLELRRMVTLDADNSVLSWTKKHRIRIEYGDKMYVPDFLIEYRDGTKVLEEVKGWITEKVIDKKVAAEKYCLANDMTYRMLFEKDIDEIENSTK
jgi:hypothetical protein